MSRVKPRHCERYERSTIKMHNQAEDRSKAPDVGRAASTKPSEVYACATALLYRSFCRNICEGVVDDDLDWITGDKSPACFSVASFEASLCC